MLAKGKLPVPIVLGLLVVLMAVSCSDDDPVAPPPVTSVTGTIGPGGGSLKSADGRLTLTIPQGALPGNSEVTIRNVDPASVGPELPGQSAVEILSEQALTQRAGLAMTFNAPANPAPPVFGAQQASLSFQPGFIATKVGSVATVIDSLEFFFDAASGAIEAFGSLDLGGPTPPDPPPSNTAAAGVSVIVAVGLWPGLNVTIDGIPDAPLGGNQNSFTLTTTITGTPENIVAGDEVLQWRTFPPPHLFYSGKGGPEFFTPLSFDRGANTVTHTSSSYFCVQVCQGACEPVFVELFFLDCTRPGASSSCTEMLFVASLPVECAGPIPQK